MTIQLSFPPWFTSILEADDPAILADIEQALTPFFATAEKRSDTDVRIRLRQTTVPLEQISHIEGRGTKVVVDASLYAHQQCEGIREGDGDQYRIFIRKTGTLFEFDRPGATIAITNADFKLLRMEAIRLIKSLASLKGEQQGALMLHASAITTDDKATMFLGDTRNGKTTILLEMLTGFKCDMVSCDTSFVFEDANAVGIRGWPSNFSISLGTIYDFPCLHDLAPAEARKMNYRTAWAVFDKHVLDTGDVLTRTRTIIMPQSKLRTIVFINFCKDRPAELSQAVSSTELRRYLEKVYLGSRDWVYPNWHGFYLVDGDLIATNLERMANMVEKQNISCFVLNWSPAPASFLHQIPELNVISKSRQTWEKQ
jgi:hypothetical protein